MSAKDVYNVENRRLSREVGRLTGEPFAQCGKVPKFRCPDIILYTRECAARKPASRLGWTGFYRGESNGVSSRICDNLPWVRRLTGQENSMALDAAGGSKSARARKAEHERRDGRSTPELLRRISGGYCDCVA